MQYRPDIDGLRAVAVLPVMLFHAGYLILPGGFLGVDVFFVISGYLITGLLLKDLQDSRFSILRFYERRARRILPALTLVVVATWLLCFVFLPPLQFKEFSQSLVAVVFFVSNIFFYLESGYFAQAAEEMPMLHTWSLAVEEQFYLFFPVVLWFSWRWLRPYLLHIFIATSAASILGSQFLLAKGYDAAAFYLIPSRAWELLVGAILALYASQGKGRPASNLVSATSFVVLLLSFVFFNRDLAHPGLATLIPVAATAGIIAFTGPSTIVYRILASRPFVSIGLISYSLYLWHQPLLAVIRVKTVGTPSIVDTSAVLAASFALAYLSYRFVEKPCRNRAWLTRNQVFGLATAASIMVLATGLVGHVRNGLPARFDVPTYQDSIVHSPMRGECHTRGLKYLRPAQACVYGDDTSVTWAVFGDSHLVEPAFAISEKLRQKGEGLLHLTFSQCMPARGIDVGPRGCREWYDEALEYLVNSRSIENVLIGFRYSYHLFGDLIHTYPDVPNLPPYYEQNKRSIFDDWAKAREDGWEQFRSSVQALKAAGKRVFVLYPIPELPTHISKITSPRSVFSDSPLLDTSKVTPFDLYRRRHRYILEKLETLEYDDRLIAVKAFEPFCDREFCSAVIDNKAMYFDDDHLSIAGARRLVRQQLDGIL